MNAVVKPKESNYFTDDMSNEEYHKPEHGLSSSVLKTVDDPASIVWGQLVEKDRSKLTAIDFGTDFHLYFLENEEFSKMYTVLPVFNRRKPAEKQEELDLIKKLKEEGTVPVKNEDFEKCKAMRESAMNHPTIAAIMALDGVAERSYFWTDERTGVQCKCRPDWIVLGINDDNRPAFMPDDCTTLVFDLKTIAQIDRMQNQMEELQYFVQEAFYTQGIEYVTKSKVFFVFGFVSTSLSLGRYPVKVISYADTSKFDGKQKVNDALSSYAALLQQNDDAAWQSVVTMDRPAWATKEEDIF